jgi:hypothetical protein
VAARLLSLGAFVLVVVACGADAVPSEESSSADTFRIETVIGDSGPGGADEFRLSSVVDYARDRSSFVDPTTGCGSTTIGDVSYIEVPREAGMPPGKRWVRNDLGMADAEAQFEASQRREPDADRWTSYAFLFGFPDPPPAEYLAYLREHGELERSGEEDVRDVPTTRYRTTLDRKQLTREQLEHEGWKDANIEAYLKTIPETEEEVEIWVDAANLTRRVVTTTTTEFAYGPTHRSVTTTEYFDFGVAAAIEAPPAADAIESEEWRRLQEQQRQARSGTSEQAAQPSASPSCR